MWNEPMPTWRTARKQHQCQGDGCAQVIAVGERYLDPFATPQTAISDTVRSAPSLLSQRPTVTTSSTVAMIFLIATSNAFPARNGKA